MLFEIAHHTEFRYSRPVFIEPLTLRLCPRCDAAQTVRSHALDIRPTPSGASRGIGLHGDEETVWFDGLHEQLTVNAVSVVQTRRADPFAFLVTDPGALAVPLTYDPRLRPLLAPYLERSAPTDAVSAFAHALQQATGHDTLRFLSLLAERLHTDIQYTVREHGPAWSATETLAQGRGACRDLAELYLDACRSVGIAARFVSGYCYTDSGAECRLHAWAEVYLPGAGWRGFDPSEGLAVAERHVAVAVGRAAADASPTEGHFRGDATPRLTATVMIKRLDSSPVST